MKKRVFNTKEEWANARYYSIGSSEAAGVLGKSNWVTEQDIYNKIALHKVKKIPQNERMIVGTKAEKLIRSLFALDTQERYKIKNPPRNKFWLFYSEESDMITCSPDGFIKDKIDNNLYGLEIKHKEIIKTEDRLAWESDVLPDQYYCQILQYLLVVKELKGVCLLAHLVYKRYEEKTQKFVFDKSVDKQIWIFRSDVEKEVEFLKRKELELLERCKNHQRPPTKIKFGC